MSSSPTFRWSTQRLPAGERRNHLIVVARRTFEELGADGASMQKIADAAMVNSSLLYQHFKSNQHLFEVAVLEPLEGLVAGTIEELSSTAVDEATDDDVLALQRALLGLMVEAGSTLGMVMFADKFPGREFYLDRIRPRLHTWVETTLRRHPGIRRSGRDPEMLATALVSIHLSVALDAHLRGQEIDIAVVAGRLNEMFLFGLLKHSINL